MKTSVWDILTGVVILGMLCMIGAFGAILINPSAGYNPFPPKTGGPVLPTLVLPTATMTVPGLPPTWTPSPTPADTQAPVNANGLRASSTPAPTNTVVVLPSFTPSKTARTGFGGGTCSVTYQQPADNSTQTKGKAFTVRWTIKNTSKDTWAADSVDIRFVSGDRVHTGNDVRDFPYDVAPGGMLDLTIDMNAPATAGSYVSNWQLAAGSKSYCNFYITFRTN